MFLSAKLLAMLFLLPLSASPASGLENGMPDRYKNTVYLPYYRLPRQTPQSSYPLSPAEGLDRAFDFGHYDTEPLLPHGGQFAPREVPQFQEYLIAGLASGRITQINYFRLAPAKEADGSIDFSGIYPQHLEYLSKLKRIYNFRLSVCVAGGSSLFLPVMQKRKLRRNFARNIVEFAAAWELDGVDFDWEYPRSEADMASYIALIQEVQRGLRERAASGQEPQHYKVSVAISRLQSALTTELFQAVDEVNFMSYDFTPRHSTMEDAIEMVEYLSARFAIPTHKIFLGLPFYGREIDTAGRRQAMTYGQLAQKFDLTPEDNEVDNYYFNGQKMIRQKFDYAQEKDLGGIMIWEIGQDSENQRSLLKALPRQK